MTVNKTNQTFGAFLPAIYDMDPINVLLQMNVLFESDVTCGTEKESSAGLRDWLCWD